MDCADFTEEQPPDMFSAKSDPEISGEEVPFPKRWHTEQKHAEELPFMHCHIQFTQHHRGNVYFIWRGCNFILANVPLTPLQLPQL